MSQTTYAHEPSRMHISHAADIYFKKLVLSALATDFTTFELVVLST